MNEKVNKKNIRKRRIRTKINGSSKCPRLSVFASNKYIVAQIIDDEKGLTLVSGDDQKLKTGTKTIRAKEVGLKIAEQAKAKKIEHVVFDRGGRPYHGRVKALAEGAREGGLKF